MRYTHNRGIVPSIDIKSMLNVVYNINNQYVVFSRQRAVTVETELSKKKEKNGGSSELYDPNSWLYAVHIDILCKDAS